MDETTDSGRPASGFAPEVSQVDENSEGELDEGTYSIINGDKFIVCTWVSSSLGFSGKRSGGKSLMATVDACV